MTDKIALDKIKEVIVECMNTAVKVFPELKNSPQPNVTVDLTGKVAGYHVYYPLTKTHTIRINKVLLNENEDEMLGQSVPHEVAHFIVTFLYGCERDFFTRKRKVTPHGKEWKMVMGVLDKEAIRCHNMDTSNASRMRRFTYKCDCMSYDLTTIRHNRILKGKVYKCRKCGGTLVRKGASNFIAPPSVQSIVKRIFTKGQPVEFEATHGRVLNGHVKRINKKSITIETTDGNWRVSPKFIK